MRCSGTRNVIAIVNNVTKRHSLYHPTVYRLITSAIFTLKENSPASWFYVLILYIVLVLMRIDIDGWPKTWFRCRFEGQAEPSGLFPPRGSIRKTTRDSIKCQAVIIYTWEKSPLSAKIKISAKHDSSSMTVVSSVRSQESDPTFSLRTFSVHVNTYLRKFQTCKDCTREWITKAREMETLQYQRTF